MRFPQKFGDYPQLSVSLLLVLAVFTNCLPIMGHSFTLRRIPKTAVKTSTSKTADEKTTARINDLYKKLPMSFESNKGQATSRVKFLARGRGYGLMLSSSETVLVLDKNDGSNRAQKGKRSATTAVSIKLQNANSNPRLIGLDQLSGKTNYFIGNDPTKWQTEIPNYARVKYEDVYPGIDMVYYGTEGQLEYDLVVAPGANPGLIRLGYKGAQSLSISKTGDLIISIDGGSLQQHKPIAYQFIAGRRKGIPSSYVITDKNRVRIAVGSYDSSKELIIDPVITYSTYLGGSRNDRAWSVAMDNSGNAYVAGETLSTNFPVANAMQPFHSGSSDYPDAWVTKLDSTGTTRIYSTYIGGTSHDEAYGIALDSSNNVYVLGETFSTDFPIQNALQPTGAGGLDAFVLKLNSTGSALIYSTFLGGSQNEVVGGIAVDSSGSAYVVGSSQSPNFPTVNAVRPTYGGGTCSSQNCYDAFVSKVNAAGSSLVYSTYLGGSLDERGVGIAIGSSGKAYVTGFTGSTNFPTANALQSASGGGNDAFVTALTETGTAFLYSTYLGGQGADQGYGIAVDSAGDAYVTGGTASTNFPTFNATQPIRANGADAFVTRISAAGTSLVYSTYLGGAVPGRSTAPATDEESGVGIDLDSASNAYIVGYTDRADFPLFNPVQSHFGGVWDVFVTKLNPFGGIVYSTYIGGTEQDSGKGIAVDPSSGDILVCGMALSPNFPIRNALQPTNAGGNFSFSPIDGFVLKLSNVDGINITGRIADPWDNGVSSVKVSLTGSQSQTDFTDANGNYSFPNLNPGGNYTVTPTRTNYTFDPPVQSFSNLTADQVANFTGLVDHVTISGIVKDSSGAGVSGVTVSLSGSQTASVLTTAGGTYSFANLDAGGTYTVTPTRNSDTFVPGSKTFANMGSDQTVDFTLVYGISGRVTDAVGTGTAGITLTLSGAQAATTETDSSGNYGFTNLSANGNYTVTPSKLGYTITYNFNPTSRSFSLTSNQTADFSFTNSTNIAMAPLSDAYVQDGTAANTNFGSVTPMLLRSDNQTGQRRDVYFKFDLSAVSRNINTVKLRIYAALSAAGSVATSAYSVTDTTWTENAITWNNKPARSASALTGATATITSTTYASYDIDVTSYVKGEKAAGRDIVSLALHDPSNSTPNIFLNSREALSNKPQLVVITNDNNNSAPAVSLTSPGNGAVYTAPANIPLTATASDTDGTISKVEFYAGTTLIGNATASPYSITWSNVAAGNYSLTAVATDNYGATTTASTVDISVVASNSPPTVSLNTPLNNTTFSPGANISLAATAGDMDGTISKVEFFAGAALIGTATTPTSGNTYSVTWNNVPVGAYVLTAKATDNGSAATTSAAVNINVVGQTGLSPTADAYVKDGSSAATNFGTATDLQTQIAGAGSNRESYLRFDLTTVSAITSAKLRVYGKLSDASGSNVPVGIYSVASTTWVESGSGSITWNNKPVSGGSALSNVTVTDNAARWYEFDVSAYIQSEKSAGRNVVSFALKSLASSSPFTSFNSREATNNRPQLVLWTTQPRNALLVVGSTNLNAGDNAAKTRLQNLGFTVTVKQAGTNNNAINTSDADGKAVVVISSTVIPANVGNKFRYVSVPVVTWEFDILDDMGMTGLTSGTDFGTSSTAQTQLNITSPTHPLAAGLSGTLAVVTTGSNFTWGIPNANAAKIAALNTDATKFVIFGYENGVTMPGLDAPARRVSLFMTDLTAGSLNTNGGSLFDAAIKWSTDVVTTPIISTLTASSGPAGITISVAGLNFGSIQGSSTLTFNGVASTPTSWSDRTILVAVPLFATTGPVIVTVNGVASNSVTFTVGEVDSDSDGLPDWWESQYFGNLSHTAGEDADGDGLTNLQEYQQGRNPTKASQADDGTGVDLRVHTPLVPDP